MAGLGAKPENKPLAQPSWPDEVYRVLKQAGIRQVGMVPDAGHIRLIAAFEADPETRLVTLTTEEEGVAMLAGAWLGGQRGRALAAVERRRPTASTCCRFQRYVHMPLLLLVTIARRLGEFNPWQIPMGQGTQAALEAIGVIVTRADEPDLVAPAVQGAANLAFNTWRPAAVLIGQRVLGAKNFKELGRANDPSERAAASPRRRCRTAARARRASGDRRARRAELGRLRRRRQRQQFSALGRHGRGLDDGAGLALAQPKRNVLVITGDGEMLMSLGALATIAVERPRT